MLSWIPILETKSIQKWPNNVPIILSFCLNIWHVAGIFGVLFNVLQMPNNEQTSYSVFCQIFGRIVQPIILPKQHLAGHYKPLAERTPDPDPELLLISGNASIHPSIHPTSYLWKCGVNLAARRGVSHRLKVWCISSARGWVRLRPYAGFKQFNCRYTHLSKVLPSWVLPNENFP